MFKEILRGGLLLGLAATVACGKKSQDAVPDASAAAPSAESAAAAGAEVADPAMREALQKKRAVERALAEQAILDEAKGQWAVAASASSTYSAEKDATSTDGYAPMQATGKPDVEHYGDDARAWAAARADGGIEWLEASFATPVSARELRVRQNSAPGAIIKVELIDEAGGRHTVWEGTDDTVYESGEIQWFVRSFAPTAYKTRGARLTLATSAVEGWNEIDAVQLIEE